MFPYVSVSILKNDVRMLTQSLRAHYEDIKYHMASYLNNTVQYHFNIVHYTSC